MSIWPLGIPGECSMERLMITTADGYTTETESFPIEAGILKIVLPPTSAMVLKYKKLKTADIRTAHKSIFDRIRLAAENRFR